MLNIVGYLHIIPQIMYRVTQPDSRDLAIRSLTNCSKVTPRAGQPSVYKTHNIIRITTQRNLLNTTIT